VTTRSGSLGGILAERLRQGFVGRRAELEQLARIHEAAKKQPQLALVSGAAGVGKTLLTRRFALDCAGRVLFLPISDKGAELALPIAASAPRMGDADEPDVLVLDAAAPLDFDACMRLLDQAGAWCGPRVMIIVCTRSKSAWRARIDPGMGDIVSHIALANFSRGESAELCAERGLVPQRHVASDDFFALTGGHPLALALLIERQRVEPDWRPSWTGSPDVLALLLREFLADAPSPRHREVLQLASLVEPLDEELAADVLGRSVREEFAWLWESPLCQLDPDGARLVPVARDVLYRTLMRDSHAQSGVRDALCRALFERLGRSQGKAAIAALCQLLQARRDLPLLRDGRVATAIAEAELSRPSEAELAAFCQELEPAPAQALAELAPSVYLLRAGGEEGAVVLCEAPALGGDHLAALFAVDAAPAGARWLAGALPPALFDAPGRAHAWLAHAAVNGWLPADLAHTAVLGRERWELGDGGTGGGLAPGLRVVLASLGVPLPTTLAAAPARTPGAERLVRGVEPRPDREAFLAALRAALQGFHRAHELRDSKLLGCALMAGDGRAADPPRLQALLRALVAEIAGVPGYAREADILRVTFLEPSAKQQAAAAELGMPYGTYRHRLRAALGVMGDLLWQREIDARAALGEA
jgi:hypothetical protein